MRKIDFNDTNFVGFEEKEEILLDTGVVLGLLNKYDSWHNTILKLFNNHILNNQNAVVLYINPTLINEVTHLVGKPLEQYRRKHPTEHFSQQDIVQAVNNTTKGIKGLIENEILIVLDGDKNTVLKQLELYKDLGSADAVHASLANEYGISLLTVDNRLVNNILSKSTQLPDINNLYYTIPIHRSY